MMNADWLCDKYLLCRMLSVPLMHISFFLIGSEHVVTEFKDRIKHEAYNSKCVSPDEIKEFNLLKSQFQLNYGL